MMVRRFDGYLFVTPKLTRLARALNIAACVCCAALSAAGSNLLSSVTVSELCNPLVGDICPNPNVSQTGTASASVQATTLHLSGVQSTTYASAAASFNEVSANVNATGGTGTAHAEAHDVLTIFGPTGGTFAMQISYYNADLYGDATGGFGNFGPCPILTQGAGSSRSPVCIASFNTPLDVNLITLPLSLSNSTQQGPNTFDVFRLSISDIGIYDINNPPAPGNDTGTRLTGFTYTTESQTPYPALGDGVFVASPEPATWELISACGLGLLLRATLIRRKGRRSSAR